MLQVTRPLWPPDHQLLSPQNPVLKHYGLVVLGMGLTAKVLNIKYMWFGLVGFYGISTIVGYLMINHPYTYIWNICDLVWLGFMVYQPLLAI